MSLEIDVLPNGEIRFPRNCTKKEQEVLIEALSTMVDGKKIEEIKKFFEENDNRKILIGKEILCG